MQRLFILFCIIAYFFDWLDMEEFIFFYIISLCLPTIILGLILFKRKQFLLSKPGSVFNKALVKEMFSIAFYGIIGGFGSLVIFQVDSILVNKYLGLGLTGIYATNFYFGSLILIASRTLLKISTTIISDSWKVNNLDNIFSVYKKSSINQAVVSIFLFVLLWINIENVYHILPPKFEVGKWVIFFIGITNVIDMSTGANSLIIQTSRYYKVNTLFILIWLISLIITNIIFIPIMGITGAALGTMISSVFTNLLRFIFLKYKFNMQPFDYKILLLMAVGIVVYLAGHFIPEQANFIVDMFIRTAVSTIIFVLLILKLKISEEISNEFFRIFRIGF